MVEIAEKALDLLLVKIDSVSGAAVLTPDVEFENGKGLKIGADETLEGKTV